MKAENSSLVVCPDCGSINVRIRFIKTTRDSTWTYAVPIDTDVISSAVAYEIMGCGDCGSVFLHPQHWAESASVYTDEKIERYTQAYFPEGIHPGGGPAAVVKKGALAERIHTTRLARSASGYLAMAGFSKESWKGLRVLEVGCACGALLKQFMTLGCEVYGVEISRQAVEAQMAGLRVFRGTVEDAGYPGMFFDLIVAVQVCEHLFDFSGFCREIRRILKPQGRFVYEVPRDSDGYRCWVYPRIWWMIPPIHIRYFTLQSAISLFARNGLVTQRCRTTGSVGGDLFLVTRWLLRRVGIDVQHWKKLNWLIRASFKLFCTPFDVLLSHASLHSELIAVCAKAEVNREREG